MNAPAPAVSRVSVPLLSGTLSLGVTREDWALHELCGFASRANAKRGYLFVSKVLGKHYPVRPSRMRQVHQALAEPLRHAPGPALVIAMAETAIGLGHGIYDAWREQTGRQDLLFLHTTRYHLSHRQALTFVEPHSHAADHLLYEPVDPGQAALCQQARTLVVIDDEISTGNTLINLAQAFCARHPAIEQVICVCITDWLGDERRNAFLRRLPTSGHLVSLLAGEFTFAPSPSFLCKVTSSAVGNGERKDHLLPSHHGRLGLHGPLPVDASHVMRSMDLHPADRLLVLGTGEFLHAPFLLAHALEAAGFDVTFQSTTRSPILTGNDIACQLAFPDNYGDGILNYLYNVSPGQYDRVLLCYETPHTPPCPALVKSLGATPLCLV